MSSSTKVLIGLVLGVLTGVFLGEMAGRLQLAGDVFIMLLQMTVIPYMTVSLISGVGRLGYEDARAILFGGGAAMAVLWALSLLVVLAIPLSFPDWESSAFFSSSLVEEPPPIDFLLLYLPANPFYSLSNTLVPAIVLFSIALGLALIGNSRKQPIIDALDVIAEALMGVTGFVARLAPYGVFALVAAASGTVTFEDIGRIEVYLVTYALVALLMTFWLLPGLVTVVTPLRHREVVGRSRDALVTAFATGNLLIILPILAKESKELLSDALSLDEASTSSVEVLVPASYNFPSAGKLISLAFVPFAAWFVGSQLTLGQYPSFLTTGFFSFFGQTVTAVPFLLDMFRLPPDMAQLFVTVDVVASRFGVMLAAMHTLVIALLGTCAVRGELSLHWRQLGRFLGVSALVLAACIAGARGFFDLTLENQYRKDQVLAGMHLERRDRDAKVFREMPDPPPAELARLPALKRIRALGTLRVGYLPNHLPWSFFNSAGELVGFDIEMADDLARQLDVALEFVPVAAERLATHLRTAECDVVMAGIEVTVARAEQLAFSKHYLRETLALVVPGHRRGEFADGSAIVEMSGARFAVRTERYYLERLADFMRGPNLVPVDDFEAFFEAPEGTYDAMIATAETGSAWTLLYPRFSVVVPAGPQVKVPLAYAVAPDAHDLLMLIDAWIELRRADGTFGDLYDYWVRGIDAEGAEPRWSVVRNVLGWVD